METTKETKDKAPRANGIKTMVWQDGVMIASFIHGATLMIDPRRMSEAQRVHLLQHGIEARAGDKCAVGATEYPDRIARSEEAYRRMEAWRDHAYSSDDWEMKGKGGGGTKPDLGLMLRAFAELGFVADRTEAGLAEMEALLEKQAAAMKADREAAIKAFWETGEVTQKVAEYRAAAKAANAPTAASLIAGLKKA